MHRRPESEPIPISFEPSPPPDQHPCGDLSYGAHVLDEPFLKGLKVARVGTLLQDEGLEAADADFDGGLCAVMRSGLFSHHVACSVHIPDQPRWIIPRHRA